MANVQSSVADYNNQFMKDNPQYGYSGASNPTATPLSNQQQGAINKQTPQTGYNSTPTSTGTNISYTNNSTSSTTPTGKASTGLLGIGAGTSGAGADTGLYKNWLQNQATSPTPAQGSINTLNNVAQNGSPQVQQANQNVQGLLNVQNEIANNPNLAAEIASGRGQAISGEINAAQTGMQNALAQQNQQITAGNEAGNLGLTGQSQQLGAANNAAGLGLTQQGQQISSFTGVPGPVTGPSGVLYQPQSVTGDASGNTTFGGGQARAQGTLGEQYTGNQATLGALTGSTDGNGQGGMVGNFVNALTSSGLNQGNVNLGNALQQGLSANTSGPYAALQNNFQNILAQYGKILGTQTVNELLTSSQNQTISQFLQSLSSQAQQVQQGNLTAGTGQSGNSATSAPSTPTPSTPTPSSESTGGSAPVFGSFF